MEKKDLRFAHHFYEPYCIEFKKKPSPKELEKALREAHQKCSERLIEFQQTVHKIPVFFSHQDMHFGYKKIDDTSYMTALEVLLVGKYIE